MSTINFFFLWVSGLKVSFTYSHSQQYQSKIFLFFSSVVYNNWGHLNPFFRSTLLRIIRHMLKIPLEPLSYNIIRLFLLLRILATAHFTYKTHSHKIAYRKDKNEREKSLITFLRSLYFFDITKPLFQSLWD